MYFAAGSIEWYAEQETEEKVQIHDFLIDALAGCNSRVQNEVHVPGAVDTIHENIQDNIESGYPDVVRSQDEEDVDRWVERYIEDVKFDLENR